jgi:hypothetical protein
VGVREPSLSQGYRGAKPICWLHIGLAAAAATVYVLLFGPRVGVPKVSDDGSFLILSGILVALLAAPTLLLFVPALRVVRATSPPLFWSTLLAGALLIGHIAFVAYSFYKLSQSTDL